MSWWNSSGWTDFASQASQVLKNAQQKIDKVLDITEEEERAKSLNEAKSTKTETSKPQADDGGSEFFNSWLPSTSKEDGEKPKPKSPTTQPTKEVSQPAEKEKPKTKLSLSKKASGDQAKSKLAREKSPTAQKNPSIPDEDETFGGWGSSWGQDSSSSWGSFSEKKNKQSSSIEETKKIPDDNEKSVRLKGKKSDNVIPTQIASTSENITVIDLNTGTESNLSQSDHSEHTKHLEPELKETLPDPSVPTEPLQISDVEKTSASDQTAACEKLSLTENTESLEQEAPLVNEPSDVEPSELPKELEPEEIRQPDVQPSQDVQLDSDNCPKEEIVCNRSSETEESQSTEPQIEETTISGEPIIESFSASERKEDEENKESGNELLTVNIPCDTELHKPLDNQALFTVDEGQVKDESDLELTTEPDDPLSASDTTILTLSGTDYQQTTLDSDGSAAIDAKGNSSVQNVDVPPESQSEVQPSDDVSEPMSSKSSQSVDDNSLCEQVCDSGKLDSSVDTGTSGDTVIDSQEMDADRQSVTGIETLEQSSDSLGGSFVKCMIEEAMEDTLRPDDSGSDNHSNGEKSESSKLESEIDKSVSGHESSDEIETTTSSDIEIISAPTPNGEYKLFDLSPLKIALQKTVQRGSTSHRRSDSQSSSSTYSKAGESDQLSPGRDSIERQDIDSGDDFDPEHHRRMSHDDKHRVPELSVVSEETGTNNPYQTDKLLKTAKKQDMELVKKLADMAEVLQARENKLVQLSKENNGLLETNSILRSQLQQSEEAHNAKMEDVETLTEEFKRRITEGEKKFSGVIKEKENLKKQLGIVQDELNKKMSDRSQLRLIEEKDEQIKELLQEGEKLSKQQLQSNNIIKKLRSKEKESDSAISSFKSKNSEMTKELEHLRKVCEVKDDLEKKQTDAINQLNSAVQKQEKELMKYRSEENDLHEKMRSLQTALDNSYKEIAELHKANAAQDSKANEIALSVEMQIREEAKQTMNKELMKARQEKEDLIMQIEDLRITMARMEKDQSRREDMLRQEISDLQFQLQADEARNQELSQNVSTTTRPLLRQIENLQAAYKAQAASFEKVEKNLTDRLTDTQNQLAIAVEKERTASEKLMDVTTQITSLEAQNARLKQEKSQLTVQIGMDKAKIDLLEEAKQNETAHIEAIKNQTAKEIAELKRDKVFLESQIEMEKNKVEAEKRKGAILDEQLKMLERERPKSRGTPSPISISRQESVSSFTDQPPSFGSLSQEDILERSLMSTSMSSTNAKLSVYDQLRHTGATALIEGLQSQLKLREGEITHLQSEITQLERTRESMAKELVNLTNQNEELQEQLKAYPELVQNFKELDNRYNAILQMYGEKVEETEELKLDLEDVKEMYKQQINHLLTK